MKNIILLDDDADILQLVREVLNDAGFAVRAVTRSAAVLPLTLTFRPDLFILDYRLSDGNGGELCRTLKQHPDLAGVPVILYSAYTGPELQAYGCDAVLGKPFDIDELVSLIQHLTGR